MSSGHDRAIVLMNSLQLWLASQDLYKIGAIIISSYMWKGLMSPPPLTRESMGSSRVIRGSIAMFVSVIGTAKLAVLW